MDRIANFPVHSGRGSSARKNSVEEKVPVNAFEYQFPSVYSDIWFYPDSKGVTSANKYCG